MSDHPVHKPRKAGGSKFWLSVISVIAVTILGFIAGLLGVDVPDSVYVCITGINGGHAIGNVGEYFGRAAQQRYFADSTPLNLARGAAEVVEESLTPADPDLS